MFSRELNQEECIDGELTVCGSVPSTSLVAGEASGNAACCEDLSREPPTFFAKSRLFRRLRALGDSSNTLTSVIGDIGVDSTLSISYQ